MKDKWIYWDTLVIRKSVISSAALVAEDEIEICTVQGVVHVIPFATKELAQTNFDRLRVFLVGSEDHD